MMNTNSKMNGPISRNQLFPASSVVGYKLPFVGLSFPGYPAFIGRKLPLIKNHRQFGFTLIELIITLVVAAILFAIAIPNMRTFIQNGRLSSQANDFVTDLTYARSEAIKRGVNVGVCVSTSGTACPALASPSWETGRLIFVDSNNDNAWNGTPPDVPLRFRDFLGGANTQRAYLSVSGVPLTGPLIFNSQGFLVWAGGTKFDATTVGAPITFNLCDTRGVSRGRAITLTWTGTVRVMPSTTPPASCP